MNAISLVLLAFVAIVVGEAVSTILLIVLSPVLRVVDELRAAHPIRRRPKAWKV